ncbi:hypothetical protein LJB91_03710 [Bacteroidales bacterium OttesenSCG-928-L03]|nr:hypothetical protein [Bacteroidales bacterium OttesenSCG-928-L03]
MSTQTVNLECPGCGAGVAISEKVCKYCDRPIVITTFNSVYSMSMPEVNKYANTYRKVLAENPDNQVLNTSIAMCYLKLNLYDRALPAFEKAIEDNFDNAETFYYAAVCLLKGQKAFLAQRANIDKAIEYLNAALMIEPRGIFYYFLAYIKYDYFERKYLNTSPNFRETLEMAVNTGLPEGDIMQFYDILKVPRPDCL